MYCMNCGAELDPDSNFCPSCGYATDGVNRTAASQQTNIMVNHKSEGLAIILAIILTGAGHMYAGKVKEGILLLLTQIVLVAMSFVLFSFTYNTLLPLIGVGVISILSFAIWIYSIIDSNKAVKEYNAALMETGNPPW